MEIQEVVLKDFISSEYYHLYKKRIDDYSMLIVKSIVESQWIDNDKTFTWWDVLKEVLKFVNWKLNEFPEAEDLNPTHTNYEDAKLNQSIEEASRAYLWINGMN